MKFDASQFDNLEFDNIGQWPKPAKILLAIALAIMVAFLGYLLLIRTQMTAFDRAFSEEGNLKNDYSTKYHVAVNLDLFRDQMIEAEDTFANQLRSLPDSHEIPGLLDDITFVGTTSGLKFAKLEWRPEISNTVYIELPIDIEVIGTYHAFGQFVSKISGLPRIVTLHDFKISPLKKDKSLLKLTLQAKTYRYQGESI